MLHENSTWSTSDEFYLTPFVLPSFLPSPLAYPELWGGANSQAVEAK